MRSTTAPVVPVIALTIIAALGVAVAPRAAYLHPRNAASAGVDRAEISELWVEPEPGRDLLYGVGGKRLAPQSRSTFEVVNVKKGGFSNGYTVRDERGREWSAKLYPEARTEVVASRLLWGIGYHQPPIYSVQTWSATGAAGDNPQPVARFREKEPPFHGLTEDGGWSYADNPFLGSRPLAGLLVLQVMLANADLKPGNNMRYTLTEPSEGAMRWYVARDLGQSFGRSGLTAGLRDDIEAFDRTRFITGVNHGSVEFEFYSFHTGLLKNITPQDVRWISLRMAKLTDEQWLDAFRAGGYEDRTALRYIRRMKIKVAEGLAVGRAE